jgi:hypothetical protein
MIKQQVEGAVSDLECMYNQKSCSLGKQQTQPWRMQRKLYILYQAQATWPPSMLDNCPSRGGRLERGAFCSCFRALWCVVGRKSLKRPMVMNSSKREELVRARLLGGSLLNLVSLADSFGRPGDRCTTLMIRLRNDRGAYSPAWQIAGLSPLPYIGARLRTPASTPSFQRHHSHHFRPLSVRQAGRHDGEMIYYWAALHAYQPVQLKY